MPKIADRFVPSAALASCALLACAFAGGCGREKTAAAPKYADESSSSSKKTGAEAWTKNDDKEGAKPAQGSSKTAGTALPAEAPVSPLGYVWDGQYAAYSTPTPLATAVKKCSAALYTLGFQLDGNATRVANDTAVMAGANEAKLPIDIKMRTVAKADKKETEIKIRIGVTGDRAGAERVLDELRKELAKK
ncbi:MAG: DUF3568 family protein [Planctomycetes bacterium]|nr:DUF3568 family protein [Planctomycetota bacterium]